MLRTDALKWFWPFMLVAALAGATIIALPPFVPAKATAAEPQFRMLITVKAQQPHVADAIPVTIDPSRIEVNAKRPASIIERLAALLPHRHPS